MPDYVNSLKEWTGKASATIIYDSVVDEFTDNEFFRRVQGKENIAIVATTTDGDVFGGFYSAAAMEQEDWFHDPNVFAFSFESHGRCETPQRFAVKEQLKWEVCVEFWEGDRFGFLAFHVDGYGAFTLGDEKSDCHCWNMSDGFEGLENTTLSGDNNTQFQYPPHHHCARLIAVHLE